MTAHLKSSPVANGKFHAQGQKGAGTPARRASPGADRTGALGRGETHRNQTGLDPLPPFARAGMQHSPSQLRGMYVKNRPFRSVSESEVAGYRKIADF